MRSQNKKAKAGNVAVLMKVPPGLLQGLPREDQRAISEIVGKPIILAGYDVDGGVELQFTDADEVYPSILVNPKFVRVAQAASKNLEPKTHRRQNKSKKLITKNYSRPKE